jgi:hypothetical protein
MDDTAGVGAEAEEEVLIVGVAEGGDEVAHVLQLVHEGV